MPTSSTSSYSYSSGGRLEIYYYRNGYAWRPFCSTYFNSYDANLACRKLGFSRASRYGRVGSLGWVLIDWFIKFVSPLLLLSRSPPYQSLSNLTLLWILNLVVIFFLEFYRKSVTVYRKIRQNAHNINYYFLHLHVRLNQMLSSPSFIAIASTVADALDLTISTFSLL